jgi:hypothetical protein
VVVWCGVRLSWCRDDDFRRVSRACGIAKAFSAESASLPRQLPLTRLDLRTDFTSIDQHHFYTDSTLSAALV